MITKSCASADRPTSLPAGQRQARHLQYLSADDSTKRLHETWVQHIGRLNIFADILAIASRRPPLLSASALVFIMSRRDPLAIKSWCRWS